MPWVKNLCRLCGHIGDVCYSIFGSESNYTLRQKIKKSLNLEISKEDFKPKEVCALCCTKIDDFCNFLDLCYATSIKFETIYYTEPWHQNLNERLLDDTVPQKQQSVIVTHNNIQSYDDGNESSFVMLQQYSFNPSSNIVNYDETQSGINECSGHTATVREEPDVPLDSHQCQKTVAKLKTPKVYPCPHCEKTFMRRSNLNAHISNHTKIRPYKCLICSKTFAVKCHLTQHNKIHTEKFQCSICSKNFDVPSKLSRHVRIHTNEKPFTCNFPQCSKSFSDNNNLKYHLLTHQNNRQFSCDICIKLFKSKKNLNTHVKTHVDDCKFYCKFCQKSFKYKHNLKSHLSKNHVQLSNIKS